MQKRIEVRFWKENVKRLLSELKDKYSRNRTINRALTNLSKDLESNNDKIKEEAKNDFKNFYEVIKK